MTNWKEEDQKKHKPSTGKKKDKEKSKESGAKTKAEGEWKKVSTVNKAVGKIKASYRRKSSGSEQRKDIDQHVNASNEQADTVAEQIKENEAQPEGGNTEACADEKAPELTTENAKAPEENKPEVNQSESKSKKHGGKHGKSKRKQEKPVILEKEPKSAVEEDPLAVLKNKVFQVIKNAFSLAYNDNEEIKINVDNIFPLLKALGLNPQSESVVDLVRDACMESSGDIDPKDFESVVLALIKEQDDELWVSRLEEKQFLFWEAEKTKEKLEAERQRLEDEREKMGFAKEEDDRDEWAEYERQKKEEDDKKVREKQEDEMYDNLKMAFRIVADSLIYGTSLANRVDPDETAPTGAVSSGFTLFANTSNHITMRFIDADGDGVISTKDVYTLMMGVGEMLTDDELFGMVNMADVDCDGKVTFKGTVR